MPRLVHHLSCLILALALSLAGPGGTGQANGAILLDLCAGDAVAQVWVDAGGNPVEPGPSHSNCPECLLYSAPLPEPFALGDARPFPPVPASLPVAVPPEPQATAHLRPDPRGPPSTPHDMWRHRDPRLALRSLHLPAPNRLDSRQDFRPDLVADLRAVP